MRVAICGCRNANYSAAVWGWLDAWLNRLNKSPSEITIVLENVKGLSAYVYDWAIARDCRIEIGELSWDEVDDLVAFPGTPTNHILHAKERRIPWRWARVVIYKETKGN